MVQKFRCYRQTHEKYDDVKIWISESFLPISHTIRYLYYRTVRPSVLFIFEPADRNSRYMTSYIWRPPKHRSFQFPTISDNNMADTRICESVATKDSPTWGKSINVYWSWNIIHVYTVMCVWGTGWGKIYCSTVGTGICFRVKVSVNGCTDKLALNVKSITVGIVWLRARVSHGVLHLLWNVAVLLIIECTAVV